MNGADDPDRSVVLLIFAAVTTFIIFVIAGVRWVNGQVGAASRVVLGGFTLLAAVVALSILLARCAVFDVLRERPRRAGDTQWRLASVLPPAPWIFILFAGIILVGSVLF